MMSKATDDFTPTTLRAMAAFGMRLLAKQCVPDSRGAWHTEYVVKIAGERRLFSHYGLFSALAHAKARA